MDRRLRLFVHVVERGDGGHEVRSAQFGPGDHLPDWAREAITNPDVWEDDGDAEVEETRSASASPEVARPSASGPNSGRHRWVDYARSKGVEVTDDMSRDQIIAAVDEV